jgi:hypothetical protein
MLDLEQYFVLVIPRLEIPRSDRGSNLRSGQPKKAQFIRDVADLVRKVTLFLDEPTLNRTRRHKILDRIAKLVRSAPWAPKQDGNGERFQSF